jgi:myo-inositol-1(or 4)-monophosphatase
MPGAIETACDLARKAGDIIRRAAAVEKKVEHKSAVDLVTDTDKVVEGLILEGLARAFPDHQVIAEESSDGIRPSGPVWYVDPLDGTSNFVHGIPHCSTSIALEIDGRVAVAAVMNPFRDELFAAGRGMGATCNGRPIRVSQTSRLDQAMLVTGFPYDRREHLDFYLKWFRGFLACARDVRRFGSAALDLCDVACGRFDGFWEWGLHPWDTAAGTLIVEEAGGLVSDFDAHAYDPWIPRILATNRGIQAEMVEVLASLGGAIERPSAEGG